MFGSLSEEKEIKVPASKAWDLFGTLKLGEVLAGKICEAIDVVEGDGGVGTVLKITLHPGLGFTSYKEKFTKLDKENKIKEAEVTEGGFLDIGFNLYRIRFEIKENPKDETASSCVVKATIEYDVKEEFAANASFVTTDVLVGVLGVTSEHLEKSN